MSAEEKTPESQKVVATAPENRETAKMDDPQWAEGLKRLYDSVVDEPLPDSFMRLLSELDDADGK